MPFWKSMMTTEGVGSIQNQDTEAVIPHSLPLTPDAGEINITSTNRPAAGPGHMWVSCINGNTFKLNIQTAPGDGSRLDFEWKIIACKS